MVKGMKCQCKPRLRDWRVLTAGAVATFVASFVFFQLFYQQHLLHREQNSLFLMSVQYVEENYHGIGWLSRVLGDYLTQYFYYLGAGAFILAVSLAMIWGLSYLLARQCMKFSKAQCTPWLAMAIATIITAWEFLRETGSSYQFASTVSIVALLAIVNVIAVIWRRRAIYGLIAAILLLPAGFWLFAYQDDEWVNMPDMAMERVMDIDNAAYFGHWAKVKALSAEMPESRLAVFYNTLANARQGQLTESIRDKIYLGPEILLPVVGPASTYMRIGATGMAWHMIGDYTMAEHCYILSMIFSPRSTGSRHLREMAQVNIDNGDMEAALKYLRMLSETSVHKRWAKDRLEQIETMPRHRLTVSDTLRSVNDMVTSLRHVCQTHPDNVLAYDYLMNYHLVCGNTAGLMRDYDSSKPNHPWYQQALLVGLSQTDTSLRKALELGVPQSQITKFADYINRYLESNGNMQGLKGEYGDTYWYQYHLMNQQR